MNRTKDRTRERELDEKFEREQKEIKNGDNWITIKIEKNKFL